MIVVSSPDPGRAGQMLAGLHAAGAATVGAPPDFEDVFCDGVHYETNPRRSDGRYLFPGPTHRHLVQMTGLGVLKTDPAYLDHLVLIVTGWRTAPFPVWWDGIYRVVADAATRGIKTWMLPAQFEVDALRSMMKWLALDHEGALEATLNALSRRPGGAVPPRRAAANLSPEQSRTLDRFVDALGARAAIEPSLAAALAELDDVVDTLREVRP